MKPVAEAVAAAPRGIAFDAFQAQLPNMRGAPGAGAEIGFPPGRAGQLLLALAPAFMKRGSEADLPAPGLIVMYAGQFQGGDVPLHLREGGRDRAGSRRSASFRHGLASRQGQPCSDNSDSRPQEKVACRRA